MGTPPWGGVRRWQLLEKHLVSWVKIDRFAGLIKVQEISNGWTHCFQTPKKPEYLIARLQLTERGPLGRSHSILDGKGVIIQITKYQQDIRVPSYK